MLKVAHVMGSYLAQSETFIWQYLHSFENIYPVVIAESFQNLDQFSLPSGKLCPIYNPKFKAIQFIDKWYRRYLYQPFGYIIGFIAKRIMLKEEVRLIHAHYGITGCNYLPVSLSLNIPLVTNFYGFDLSVKKLIDQKRSSYEILFKKGACFLVEGPSMREKLIALGCPEEKIRLQRIAIDLEQYKFNVRSWDGKRKIRLLFVGRFVEKKGLEYALHALAKVNNEYSFQLGIIGGGELYKKLRLLVLDLGLADRIVWLGMQPHRKVIEELELCDILIQPSVTASSGDSEGGAPTVILEAQACGVPVISSFHADIPYIVHSGHSALLSPERDVDSLANNLRHLINNSETWENMGKSGREHVEKYHDVRKEVKHLEKIYGSINTGERYA
jgi:colanic acid/amylovoran biosynthesis glycosyltransferase